MLFLINYVENLWIVSSKLCLFSYIKNVWHYVYIYERFSWCWAYNPSWFPGYLFTNFECIILQ